MAFLRATSGWSASKPPSGILGVTDTFVLTSGNNLADPPITSNKHGLLLAEPIVLPAMGHLAAKVLVLLQISSCEIFGYDETTIRSRGAHCFFYVYAS